MKRRTVTITFRVDNSLKKKVDAIKAEGYGRLTDILESAIEKYNPSQQKGH